MNTYIGNCSRHEKGVKIERLKMEGHDDEEDIDDDEESD